MGQRERPELQGREESPGVHGSEPQGGCVLERRATQHPSQAQPSASIPIFNVLASGAPLLSSQAHSAAPTVVCLVITATLGLVPWAGSIFLACFLK